MISFNLMADNHLEEDVDRYRALANTIIESTMAQQIDTNAIIRDSQTLIKIGVTFSKAYQVKYPQSKFMMQAIIDNATAMQNLSLAEIESQWHDSDILKRGKYKVDFDIDDEDVEDFHNPKDAVVHPATVVILAKLWAKKPKKEYILQMKAELQEVLNHLKLIHSSLK